MVFRLKRQPLMRPRLFCYLALAALTVLAAWHAPRAGDRTPPATPTAPWTLGHRELGRVRWLRDLDAATAAAEKAGKPVLLLFQEVPGCSTCVGYGTRVLSHPLIVEAIETLFIPVAVFNNRAGADREALERFREPAWNNPVVRIVDADDNSLTPRIAGAYTRAALVDGMVDALGKSKREIPTYLALLQEELAARAAGTEAGVFAMPCFWSGEGKLGALPGVVATRPGFLHGKEVVEIEFDPAVLPYEDLVKEARARRCTTTVFTRDRAQQQTARDIVGERARRSDDAIRPDGVPKYFLAQFYWRHVPMTGLQAARVNAAIGRREDPRPYLSPRQQELHDTIRAHPRHDWPDVLGDAALAGAWDRVQAAADRVAGTPAVRMDIRKSTRPAS